MAGPRGAETAAVRKRSGNGSGWTPTVANLVVLIGLEIAAYLALRYAFRRAHGG